MGKARKRVAPVCVVVVELLIASKHDVPHALPCNEECRWVGFFRNSHAEGLGDSRRIYRSVGRNSNRQPPKAHFKLACGRIRMMVVVD